MLSQAKESNEERGEKVSLEESSSSIGRQVAAKNPGLPEGSEGEKEAQKSHWESPFRLKTKGPKPPTPLLAEGRGGEVELKQCPA